MSDDPRAPREPQVGEHLKNVRLRELAQRAKEVRDLEVQLRARRDSLDGAIFYLHDGPDGTGGTVNVTEIARACSISRETVYKSIDRYRAQL